MLGFVRSSALGMPGRVTCCAGLDASHGIPLVRVFFSYSRSQFYLAEDLALALGQQGVDAWIDVHRLGGGDDWNGAIAEALRASDRLLLIASRDALTSPHVGAELELARQLGTSVVVALAEHVALPDTLAGQPCFDLRKGFDDKVTELLIAFEGDVAVAPTNGRPKRLRRADEGVVAMVSTVLLMAALVAAGWTLRNVMLQRDAATQAVNGVVLASFFGGAWWMLSRRRPGTALLVGLALALLVAVGLIAYGCLAFYLLVEDSGLELLPVLVGVCFGSAAFVAGFWAMRSRSFYRWLPTGDAPTGMRLRMLAWRGHRYLSRREPTAPPITYDVQCYELDRIVEREIDCALQAGGHRRVNGPGANRDIVVLSNLTPSDWLASTLAHVIKPVVVIAAPVSLREAAHLERYQLVDYRRRRSRTLERLAVTIGSVPTAIDADQPAPESLSKEVLPLGVFVVSTGCVFTAASIASNGIAGVVDPGVVDRDVALHGEPLSVLVALLLAGLFMWAGTRLASRRISVPGFVVLSAVLTFGHRTAQTPDAGQLDAAVVDALAVSLLWWIFRRWLPPVAARENIGRLAAPGLPLWRRPSTRRTALFIALALFMVFDRAR